MGNLSHVEQIAFGPMLEQTIIKPEYLKFTFPDRTERTHRRPKIDGRVEKLLFLASVFAGQVSTI